MRNVPLLPLSAGLLLALASGAAPAQTQTHGAQAQALPRASDADAPTRQPMQRQTGMVVMAGDNNEQVVIRSFEPDSVVGEYRIDFDALDGNGDGVLSRTEAGANATLGGEFRAVDTNADGRLDRNELSGWMR